jgi:hypothetical protein
MLGVRRQTIGEIAGELQTRRLIRYRRSDIQLIDRRALEALSCECYAEVKQLYQDVVGSALSR